jgi:hypothetical protein
MGLNDLADFVLDDRLENVPTVLLSSGDQPLDERIGYRVFHVFTPFSRVRACWVFPVTDLIQRFTGRWQSGGLITPERPLTLNQFGRRACS